MGKRIAPQPPKLATWNLWLLNRNEKPMCYVADMTESDMPFFYIQAASKVFDGSDADALLLTRRDQCPLCLQYQAVRYVNRSPVLHSCK